MVTLNLTRDELDDVAGAVDSWSAELVDWIAPAEADEETAAEMRARAKRLGDIWTRILVPALNAKEA